ncbi:XdhC family protein [Paenibacillus sp. JNUCC31]|uniref:XdhC family protein n=1 Tax=Paenibacillus sp. JNUCC-31 TaxID=2777983 RepID=UPI00177FC6E2|nr:XdhC/CoxI family protein [Paenibacillus sp. JNUCC-31]QOS79275.1 XdhC family protein [Paenibacillus sp. JNUCC-31]
MMEMHDLCAMAAREARCVLATAIKVEGHAYRKQGVSMLLTEEGGMYGSISPGCLESDLQARVDRVLDTEQLEFVEYDMRPADDLSWGETIGCGGLIIVLLEPVCGELRSILSHMHTYFQSGSTVELTRSFYHQYTRIHYVIKVLIHPSESAAAATDSGFGSGKSEFQREGRSEAERWDIPLQISTRYVPKPRLIIVGAGNDVIPVARLGQSAGFRVVVADWRETLCTPERFPGVELVQGFPREIISVLDIQGGDYIVLMSHQFPREREFLELLEDRNYAYLGIMGSRTRTARLLNDLPPMKHVHSPVGLTIGANGPEEIAISIAAELIACKRAASAKERHNLQRGNAHASDGHRAGSR